MCVCTSVPHPLVHFPNACTGQGEATAGRQEPETQSAALAPVTGASPLPPQICRVRRLESGANPSLILSRAVPVDQAFGC